MRFSPSREPRSECHKRGRSLEGGLLFSVKDDDLALFDEMESRERENFLLQPVDDLEDSFSSKLVQFPDIKLGISIPARGEPSESLIAADADKNDYDWLLTPPDTPLFPSLDDEPAEINVVSRGRTRSKPISISRSSTMEKSYRSSRGSASPNRFSPSPRSVNNTLQSRGRPSSVPNSSPTQSLWHATPSRKPSPSPNKPTTPVPRSSTPTPRRISTGSIGPAVSLRIRGASPVKTSHGNSASPKIRAWQTNIPGLSSEAPPNLRTSLADRPTTYVRGSSPASRNGRDSTTKISGRHSMSPTVSRTSGSFHSHHQDQFSSRSKGSVTSSGDDDLDSLQSIPVGSVGRATSRRGGSFSNIRTPSFPKKSARMVSPNSAPKRSFDSAVWQMDRKSPQNMFRPLLSSVPSTTFYVGKGYSAQRSLISRNSSVTTSSNASSEHGTSFAPDTEGSDHNQDDVASETEKILYSEIQEVFSFDQNDILNVNMEHEINHESVDILHNETRGPKIALRPAEFEDSANHGIDRGDFSEPGCFENIATCSDCGCRYEATDQAEENIRLCPECNRKNTLLRLITPGETSVISNDSSLTSSDIPAEVKHFAETVHRLTVSELPQETDVGNMRVPLDERDAEERQASSSDQIKGDSQQTPLPSSMVEGRGQMLSNQIELDQSEVDYENPDNHSENRLNLKVDHLLEGTGISVLLKRSSSSKGPVVQGRSFTATTISYDDLSFVKSSVNSFRSSIGHGSYSASSSVDFSSARHSEIHVQRQSSGRKLDFDCGYDTRIKRPSTASSISGNSNHSHHGLRSMIPEISVNTECGTLEDMPAVLPEMPVLEDTVADEIDASSSVSVVFEEDKAEYHNCCRLADASSIELSNQAVGVWSDDNSVTSFPNHGDGISDDNVEDNPNNSSSISNTETSVKDPESSLGEKNDVQNSNVDRMDVLSATNNSTVAESESEIEGEKCSPSDSDVVDDDPSLVSKSTVDDLQGRTVQNASNDCPKASVSELNTSECSHVLEGSTVTVECEGAGHTRSLTLEEATDTILFCSSVIHDLAYQAATIALEKEHSQDSDPCEGSKPTVTILGTGKTSSDRKESRSRTVGKRASKHQKAQQKPKPLEADVISLPAETKNDENVDEPSTRMVGLPQKVDSVKPPNKLESKCNCVIM